MKNKILIVDDSKGWLDYHQEALGKIFEQQYVLERANCAKEAYNMVYNNLKTPYALIITDLQMELSYEPKHAGEWLVEQIQALKEYSNIPIIIVSASYNIRSIANKLNVKCIPKIIAARDLTTYELTIKESIAEV